MTKTKTILILVIFILGCSSTQNDKNKTSGSDIDSIKNNISKVVSRPINSNIKYYVKDFSQYSKKSLMSLYDICKFDENLEFVSIIDDKVTCIRKVKTRGDSTYQDTTIEIIPTTLPLNKIIKYKISDKGIIYQLDIIRTNYTNIQYEYKIKDSTKCKGNASLGLNGFSGIVGHAFIFKNPDKLGIWDQYYIYINETSKINKTDNKICNCAAVYINNEKSKTAIVADEAYKYSSVLIKE